jgi:parallel beta-helix repeat protein
LHLFVFWICFFSYLGLNAQTMVSGTISSSQTWNPAGSPYILSGTVQISGTSYPVLTIEPGTEIRFAAGAGLNIGHPSSSSYRGGLVAEGTVSQPILFTAHADTPAAGDWNKLSSLLYTVSDQLSFSNCIFEYGGGTGSIFEVSGSHPSFTGCTFRYSQGYGIYHPSVNYAAYVSQCSFQDNGGYPLNVYQNNMQRLGEGNSFSGNNPDRILLQSQNVTTAQTWRNYGVPYEPVADIFVYCGATALVIEPGTQILFRAGSRLQLGSASSSSNSGSLVAEGVLFSALDPTPGSWVGIVTGGYAVTASTDIGGSTIEYAGASYAGISSAVFLATNGGIGLSGCNIRHSAGWGIYLHSGTNQPTIENCIFSNNLRSVSLPAVDVWRLGSGNSYTGSSDQRPEVRGGSVTSTCTWVDQGIPWFINGDLTISGTSSPLLTIEPGSALEFSEGSSLLVGSPNSSSYYGGISADNVTFKPDSSAIWAGIDFRYYSLISSLANCIIQDFGSVGLRLGANRLISIQGLMINNGNGFGIELSGDAKASISSTTIMNCANTISIYARDLHQLGTGNIYLLNDDNRIQCLGGAVSYTCSWISHPVPIRVCANIEVSSYSRPVLTMGYGNVFEFSSGTGLTIGTTSSSSNRGAIRATGITFRGEEQAAGFWSGIIIRPYADACLISGCTIRDAGFGLNPAITVFSTGSTLTGSTVTNCSQVGFYLGTNGRISLSANQIENCGSNPISVPANAVSNIGPENDFSGNAIDRIEVRAETINNSTVWRDAGIPYQPTATITITGYSQPHFQIMPGAVIMFPHGVGFIIGSSSSSSNRGSLEADNVLFTRSEESAVPMGLVYLAYIVESRSILNNCIIEYAAHSSHNCAVYVYDSAPQFEACIIRETPGDGILGSGAADFGVNNCSFSNINGYPIRTSVLYFAAVSGVGNSFSNCNPNRILVSGGTITQNAEWHNPGIPIEVSSTITVTSYSSPILKINSGLQLLFSAGTGLIIGYPSSGSNRGALQASGATFAALSGTTGGWTGIQFKLSNLASSFLESCSIRHAESNVYVDGSSLNRIKDCVIRDGEYGIRLMGSNASFPIFGNHILSNNVGIHTSNNANPLIGGDINSSNSFSGNTSYALLNISSLSLDATYNWWGHEDGPTLRTGDGISGNIEYIPWRTTNIGDGPMPFNLLLPPLGAVVQISSVLLDWEEAVDPSPGEIVRYTLEYGLHPQFSTNTTVVDSLYTSQYRIPEDVLPDDSRIYWRVFATDSQGQTMLCTGGSSYFDLAIPEAPLPFVIIAPAYNEIVSETSIRLSWEHAVDPDPGDQISYWVYLDMSAGFEEADSTLVAQNQVYTGYCVPGELYFWKVKAFDQTGLYRFSNTGRFIVSLDARPRAPVNVILTTAGNDLLLQWDAVPGADYYHIYHSPDPELPFSFLGSTIEAGFSHSGALSQPRQFYKITSHDDTGRWSTR